MNKVEQTKWLIKGLRDERRHEVAVMLFANLRPKEIAVRLEAYDDSIRRLERLIEFMDINHLGN